jgi:hypothetical protein
MEAHNSRWLPPLPGNIRVFCRMRPLLSNERNARVGHLTTTPGTDTIKVVSCRKDFQFDKVFLPSSVQGEFAILCSQEEANINLRP